ncbi:MAG: AAA family ATPase [Clostridia bacterium]|nr:AAA family ATPase [Clostridia bacterium]
MSHIYVFSGPCGCGKSTLTDAYAAHLVQSGEKNQVYVIHGDDFHCGFVETDRRVGPSCAGFLYWPDILRFNWECILSVAHKALECGLDVIVDYVVEDELPLLRELACQNGARLFYVVLTTSQAELRQRLTGRGSKHLIERSLFLKEKLENAAENVRHLYDISGLTVEQEIAQLDMARYEVSVS